MSRRPSPVHFIRTAIRAFVGTNKYIDYATVIYSNILSQKRDVSVVVVKVNHHNTWKAHVIAINYLLRANHPGIIASRDSSRDALDRLKCQLEDQVAGGSVL